MFSDGMHKAGRKRLSWMLCLCLLLNLWLPSSLCADVIKEPGSEIRAETKTIAPGVEYRSFSKELDDAQPVKVHYLKAKLEDPWMEVRPVFSEPMIGSLETLTDLCEPYGAVGAVNGSFYYMGGQRSPIDTTITEQELIVKSPRPATSLLFMGRNSLSIASFSPLTTLKLPAKKLRFTLQAINRPGDGLVLYTPWFEPVSAPEAEIPDGEGLEMVLKKEGHGQFKIMEIVLGKAKMPSDGMILSFQGSGLNIAPYFNLGDTVLYEVDYFNQDKIEHLLGNGPLLVEDGYRVVPVEKEGLESALWNRHPRTAVGLTKQAEIILAVVEGRQKDSVGMTFDELADLMLELGADKAMAMDGGGSAEMLVEGQVMNYLTDGRERKLSNGIAIIYQIPVYLDAERVYFALTDGLPLIDQDRVLVPARKIFEAMGIKVDWDEDRHTVTAVKGKTTVKMQIGSSQASVNGKTVNMDVPPKIVTGRTMIPLRFISQSFESKVEWKTDTRSAYITTKP